MTEQRLSHIDDEGNARMVDVGAKADTERTAAAEALVTMQPATLAMIAEGRLPKGDAFAVARLAGIGAAKRAWELIPLAHQVPLTHASVDFETDAGAGTVRVRAVARATAKTGVELEALAAAMLAALTLYDMCKAVDRAMTIGPVRLLEKHGGARGDFKAD